MGTTSGPFLYLLTAPPPPHNRLTERGERVTARDGRQAGGGLERDGEELSGVNENNLGGKGAARGRGIKAPVKKEGG